MDYSVFIIISLGLVAAAMPFLFKNVRDKYGITEVDMVLAADMLNVSIMVLQELNIKKEDKIVNYAVIIQDSFYFIINTMGDVDNLEKEVYEYAIAQLKSLGVEVNDRRKEILRILISNFIASYAQIKNPS